MEYAYIYARFSSENQQETSIEAQVRACREYADRHGMTVLDVYADEAISGRGGSTQKRRAYQRLLNDVQHGKASVILCHQYDRLARDLREQVNLNAAMKEIGVRIIAVAQDLGDSKESRLLLRPLIWSLSEYYSENLAFETRKGLRETALKGLHTGGVAPFGYDVVDQRYVINAVEAHYVRRIFSAVLAGKSFVSILAEMRAAGIKGKRGAEIKYTQVYEMLRNEKYCGTYIYSPEEEKDRDARRSKPNAIRIEDAFPAIISREEFEEVQKILKGRKRVGMTEHYLCGGLVYCACGAKMHASRTTRKGYEYRRFYCSAKCGAHGIDAAEVDRAATAYLYELLSPETARDLAEAMKRYEAVQGGQMEEFKTAMEERIRDRQVEYDNLMGNLMAGKLPPSVVEKIGKRMEELETEIHTLKSTEPPEDYTPDLVYNWLESIKKAHTEQAIRLFVERVETCPSDDKKTTTVSCIYSTLSTVVGKTGCGGAQHILPETLFLRRIRQACLCSAQEP